MGVKTHQFRAMDTDVDVAIAGAVEDDAATAAFRDVEALFERYEQTLSRFRHDSELSALNAAAGRAFVASPLLFEAVSGAVHWANESGGIFDPCVYGALVEAGYDRTFALLRLADRTGCPAGRPFLGTYRAIELDVPTRTIALPDGIRLDLGGIGKGLTVDAAAATLAPFENYLINAGGDLYAHGRAEDGPWLAGVQDPFNPDRDLTALSVRNAAIATSSAVRRRWRMGAGERHHLIDPRTGASAETDVAAATVVAPSAVTADVLAKIALISGHDAGGRFVEAHGGSCLLVGWNGAALTGSFGAT